ncbi:hypothetical protein [Streptomyces violascens]|uniref:Uncharacterized protein n=1 Tax=Streptomyces violascens TaxID=67381 RepID=A0ABQ3QWK6_9ACTN|nr:hypothetical protein [Streptomyces violascens]GHI41666.1 hypothetical protein Sviol_60740 [Streptomyces violascens]
MITVGSGYSPQLHVCILSPLADEAALLATAVVPNLPGSVSLSMLLE